MLADLLRVEQERPGERQQPAPTLSPALPASGGSPRAPEFPGLVLWPDAGAASPDCAGLTVDSCRRPLTAPSVMTDNRSQY